MRHPLIIFPMLTHPDPPLTHSHTHIYIYIYSYVYGWVPERNIRIEINLDQNEICMHDPSDYIYIYIYIIK